MAVRPLSSLQRLMFVMGDTVVQPMQSRLGADLPDGPAPPLARSVGMDLGAWELRLDEITQRSSSSGSMRYLINGDEFFPRLIEGIESAQESVHMRTYIFDNDDFAASIGNLLKDRSLDGVRVKVLLDGIGTIMSTAEIQDSLPTDYDAPKSVHRFLEDGSNVEVRQAPNPWLTGDHVKSTIIDGETAFIGGMNIAREYRYDWHDMMVKVDGPVVREMQTEFDESWIHAGFFGDLGWFLNKLSRQAEPASVAGYPIRLLHTRPSRAEIFMVQREAMQRARKYIYVENAYFTDDVMLQELVKARHRGVDVRVIVPIVSDRGALTRDNALAANIMLEHGIRVFIYPGMSHIKAAVYDGWACLGSANFDRLSLKINREMNIATSHRTAVDDLLTRLFQPDFESSPELLEPFPERWSDHLVEVLGDYIF
jgi:cardiolipin synthase